MPASFLVLGVMSENTIFTQLKLLVYMDLQKRGDFRCDKQRGDATEVRVAEILFARRWERKPKGLESRNLTPQVCGSRTQKGKNSSPWSLGGLGWAEGV